MSWTDDGDADRGTPGEPEPFPDEGPILQASALGWKRVVGIGILAALGFLVADWMGWLGGGEPSGIPFGGVPVDTSGAPEPEPAVRERVADTPAAPPTTSGPASERAGAAPARQTEPGRAGAVGVGDTAAAASDAPRGVAVPGSRPSRPAEEGPLGLSEFVLIRPGSFQMGYSDAGTDQQPVHAVILSKEYYLQMSEVSQGQWRSVMGTNPSHFTACGDDCPVEQVSWHDAQAFIQALNQKYPGRRYRLPTEAEWEYAARANVDAGYEDPGALDEAAWFDGNSSARTHLSESKRANAWGLYDMHGNVAEWVGDWYRADYYRTGPAVDPPGPKDGAAKVVRGGSWGSSRRFVGTLGRMDRDPFTRDFNIGFRLARDP